ncbi:HigA family addiction module antitoxin [Mycobacteroides abscessus]|uniref:HigA family addiction module antitoxin n=1 Tax=Mycobacteroides abscessus TaxID=36809 RepID=UPI000E6926E3|nr:HigA family addiction module antitoxin [Mycobacteroides abscessus]RIS78145.1 addiction module antidote protein, HigA family [Mycobacteroides abscessus]
MSDFAPIHPEEILATEFLAPLGINPYKLAQATHLDQTRIGQIIKGQRAVTATTALRLSRALGTSEMFWVNLQSRYDTEVAKESEHADLDSITPLVCAADEVAPTVKVSTKVARKPNLLRHK